jgi:hypothetical protein
MTEQQPKQSGMDNSWAAWKDRLGIMGVILALLILFLFMFTDASFNFQCGVIDFITFKCNRLDRKFVPWDKFDKQHGKSSSLQFKSYGTDRMTQVRMATIM